MNPAYGIFMWIIVGGLAGLITRKIDTDAQQGALANVVVGMCGAVLGGFMTGASFRDDLGDNALIASLFIAFFGAVVVIALWKTLTDQNPLRV